MPDRESRVFRAIKSKFITLPQEKLILVQRKHWSTFVFPIITGTILGLISFFVSIFIYSLLPQFLFLILAALFLLVLITATLILRTIIDWYFNIYIVTNRKITEISYKPLSSRQINEILLDQVRCTEIDSRVDGLLDELMDVGDVVITFDRPTHQEEFVFTRVKDPKRVETFLHKTLSPAAITYTESADGENDGWFVKEKNNPGKWKYIEKINTKEGGETIWNL